MVQFYIVDADNNMMYEDHDVYTSYFESYCDAYQDIIDSLSLLKDKSTYDFTYRIIKVTVDGLTMGKSEILSSYYKGVWLHGDELKTEYFTDEFNPYMYSTLELWQLMTPVYSDCMGTHYRDRAIYNHNLEVVLENNAYDEFCKHCCINQLKEEVDSCYELLNSKLLTTDNLYYLYNKIDVLTSLLASEYNYIY